jgi:hypothetical protein
VTGKRLFWISIIIVELVLLYIVWKPSRGHFTGRSHRAALAPPMVRPPESKPPAIVIESRKPFKVAHSHAPRREKPLIVNASLKAPAPIPATPAPAPQTFLSPLESFWCHISMMDSNCDCKVSDDRASNLLMQ